MSGPDPVPSPTLGPGLPIAGVERPKTPSYGAAKHGMAPFGMSRVGNVDIRALLRPAQEAALCVPELLPGPILGPGLPIGGAAERPKRPS